MENSYKFRLLVFTFKHRNLFGIQKKSGKSTRSTDFPKLTVSDWTGHYSRLQGPYKCPRLFNELPGETRKCETLRLFKKTVEKQLLPEPG